MNTDCKPFKIGDLVELSMYPESGFSLVLDMEWDFDIYSWYMGVYCQKTGKKTWCWSHSYRVAEKRR